VDEKPSRQDVSVAQKLRITLYVISIKGIWSVAPTGQMKKQSGPHWDEKLFTVSTEQNRILTICF
jgi:hypothetical protein